MPSQITPIPFHTRSYVVQYQHPGLGVRRSSRWGMKRDAEAYAAGLPEDWRPVILPSEHDPDIFPHCAGSLSQAIGGRCFACKHVLTRADARVWEGEDHGPDR